MQKKIAMPLLTWLFAAAFAVVLFQAWRATSATSRVPDDPAPQPVRGVPFLSEIPYTSNAVRGSKVKSASGLMLMVTPRIEIQEEEEQFQFESPGVRPFEP